MVRLNVELDDQTYAAIEREAQRRGVDVTKVLSEVAAKSNDGSLADLPSAHAGTGGAADDSTESWDSLFTWLDGLNLTMRYRYGTREDIYVR